MNLTNDTTITYDFKDLADTAQSLNSDELCKAPVQSCNFDDLNYVVFVPFFLLTSETQPAFPSSLSHPDYFVSWLLQHPNSRT